MADTSSKIFFGLVALILSLVLGTEVYADGKYFPAKAYKAVPNIPGQRSVLIYKDGVEKLLIESSLEAEGKEFGWVIPLPAKPASFEKASPGFIKTLNMVIQPMVVHDLWPVVKTCLGFAIVITLWLCIILIFKPKSIIGRLIAAFIIFFVYSALMPSMSSAGFSLQVGVKVIEEQEVGSYKLFVLEAENASDLNKWLDGNGFAGLSKEEEGVVSDYIKDGWCFVTAKLKREGDGFSRPHPLVMSFPAERAVYPMRLTGVNNQPMYLELYVVSDKSAVCDMLETEVCSKFAFEKEARSKKWFIDPDDLEFSSGFSGEYDQMVGHPDADKYMWDGCVVSRLYGELEPERMKEDYYIEFDDYRPRRKVFFSYAGACMSGTILFLIAWTASVIVLTFSRYKKVLKDCKRTIALRQVAVPSLLLALILGGILYIVVPKTEVRTEGRIGGIHNAIAMQHTYITMELLGKEVFSSTDYRNIDAIAEQLQQSEVFKETKNALTGEDLKLEDSPGNITIGNDESGLFIRTYDSDGFPQDMTSKFFNEL